MARDGAIWILMAGESLAPVKAARGDFDAWVAKALGRPLDEVEVVSPFRDEALPDASAVGGLVITGSPSMVTDREPWSEAAAAWVADIVEGDRAPVLGVCFGHQLIAHGLGGEVAPNPNGREMGTVEVSIDPESVGTDPLIRAGRFPVHMSHLESVVRPPTGAETLGTTAIEANAVLRFGPRQWGVQFHPEFDADIVRRYVEARREVLLRESLDPDTMVAEVRETPESASLLSRFADYVTSIG